MTEMRGVEELLLRDRALSCTSCGVSIADARLPDLPLTYVNRAFLRMTGYERGEILGKNCRFLQGRERQQPARREIRRAIAEGRSCRVILRNFRKDGSPFWNELTLSPVLGSGGEITHFIGVQTVVTEREEARRERNELIEQLHQVNSQLEEFAYVVSHDLRAPLRGIRNAADLLRQETDELDEDAQKLLDMLVQRSQDLSLLVKGILRSSQVSLGDLKLEPVEMDRLLSEVVELLDPGPTFEIQLPAECPTILGDWLLLRQIFQNLLGNALQHHPGPEGKIEIRWIESKDERTFEIEDDGAGIPAERRGDIFRIFSTLPSDPVPEARDPRGASPPNEPGRGLGLSIVQKAVRRLGGRVAVEEGRWGGALFLVSLPRDPQPEDLGSSGFSGDV